MNQISFSRDGIRTTANIGHCAVAEDFVAFLRRNGFSDINVQRVSFKVASKLKRNAEQIKLLDEVNQRFWDGRRSL